MNWKRPEAEDVRAAWEYVRANWPGQPVILYGQSMGSAAILRAIALHRLQPVAVILECPFDTLLATVGNRFTLMGLPPFPLAHLLVFWGGVQHGFNGFRHNPCEYAQAVTCPALVLHGADDPTITKQQIETVVQCLGGEKQLEVWPGVRHEPCFAASPARWNGSVALFLERHVPLR